MGGLAKRGWDLDQPQDGAETESQSGPLSPVGLTPEEVVLLNKWTPQALQDIEEESNQYFEHGLLGSKHDVAHDLDPVFHGLLSEQRATQLHYA